MYMYDCVWENEFLAAAPKIGRNQACSKLRFFEIGTAQELPTFF